MFVAAVIEFVSEVVEFASDVEFDSLVAFEVLFYDSVLLLLLSTKLSGSTVISISIFIVFFGCGSVKYFASAMYTSKSKDILLAGLSCAL